MRAFAATRTARVGIAGLLCGLAFLAAGCSGSDEQASRSPQPGKGEAAPGSPEEAALDFFRLYQTSSWPVLAGGYDRRVVRALGARSMMDALVVGVGAVQKGTVRKVQTPWTAGPTVVTVTVRAQGKDSTVVYVLARSGETWRIRYDSLLAEALPIYVQTEVSERTGQVEPSEAAVRAGAEAASVYRSLFSPKPRTGGALERIVESARTDSTAAP